jgi:hypothetical protein
MLMTNLARHHDHSQDGAKAHFKRELAKYEGDPQPLWEWFYRVIEAFRRFKPEIICQDCNMVDVAAKRIVGASKFFSFSPDELAKIYTLDEDRIPRADRDLALNAFPAANHEFLGVCAMGRRLIAMRLERTIKRKQND